MIYAITASRNIGNKKELWPHIKRLCEDTEVVQILFGGARGGDTEALLAALNFRKDPTLKLTVVVPFLLADQPKETHAVTALADDLIELKLPRMGMAAAYKQRNAFLVEHSHCLMAFTTGNTRSGTYQTIRLAQKQSKPVEIIEVSA